MKYFFLSESWQTGRVWEFGGLWNELAWKRKPHLRRRSLCITENNDILCLYEAEESILMVEVMPKAIVPDASNRAIGQVVLKRLLTAEQAIERLCQEDDIFQHSARPRHGIAKTDEPTPALQARSGQTILVNQEPAAINTYVEDKYGEKNYGDEGEALSRVKQSAEMAQ